MKTSDFKTPEALEFNTKGIALSREGRYAEAKKMFGKALQIEPDNSTILSNLGINAEKKGNIQKAIFYFNKSISISDSVNYMAINNLGLLYCHQKQYEKGRALWDYIVENAKDDNILFMTYLNKLTFDGKLRDCVQANKDYDSLKKYQYRSEIKGYEESIIQMYKGFEKICPEYFLY